MAMGYDTGAQRYVVSSCAKQPCECLLVRARRDVEQGSLQPKTCSCKSWGGAVLGGMVRNQGVDALHEPPDVSKGRLPLVDTDRRPLTGSQCAFQKLPCFRSRVSGRATAWLSFAKTLEYG